MLKVSRLPGASPLLRAPPSPRAASPVPAGDVFERGREVRALAGVGAPDAAGPVVSWLRAHAAPLRSVEAGHGFKDLARFQKLVGDATVVGLGEATHGTREFFQMKHRLFECLVEKMGFNLFAIEASWPDCLAINDYVLNGRGDPRQALYAQGFWTCDTQEVLQLIEWMRAYNADASHPRKVQFAGVDMLRPDTSAQRLLAYAQTVDPALATQLKAELAPALDPATAQQMTPEQGAALLTRATGLPALLDAHHAAYAQASSESQWAEGRQLAVVLVQGLQDLAGQGDRDQFMAENMKWLLAHAPQGSRAVFSAQNDHLSVNETRKGSGSYLRQALGERYRSVGFFFGQGSFQAIDENPDVSKRQGLREFTVGPPPADSVNSVMERAGLPLFEADLREAAGTPAVSAWMNAPHRVLDFGSVYTDVQPDQYFRSMAPAQDFDGALFIDRTTRARPNPAPTPARR